MSTQPPAPRDPKHPLLNGHGTEQRTPAEYAADIMTEFLGSWTFILFFSFFLVVWAALNIVAWAEHWDPYPFILLNLVLSTISAFQAPIIMMSQNRQTDRDRISAKYDYAVNRKAEREIQCVQKELVALRRLMQKVREEIQQQ